MDDGRIVEVTFHDTQRLLALGGRVAPITDYFNCTLGCLGEHGVLLASPARAGQASMLLYRCARKGSRQRAMIRLQVRRASASHRSPPSSDSTRAARPSRRPLESWAPQADWQCGLPLGESVTCIAAGASFTAAATSARLLRLFSPAGLQLGILALQGPAVAMAAQVREGRVPVSTGSSRPDSGPNQPQPQHEAALARWLHAHRGACVRPRCVTGVTQARSAGCALSPPLLAGPQPGRRDGPGPPVAVHGHAEPLDQRERPTALRGRGGGERISTARRGDTPEIAALGPCSREAKEPAQIEAGRRRSDPPRTAAHARPAAPHFAWPQVYDIATSSCTLSCACPLTPSAAAAAAAAAHQGSKPAASASGSSVGAPAGPHAPATALTWLGFSDKGAVAVADSAGAVFLRCVRFCICLDTSAGPEPNYRAYQMSRSTKASEPKAHAQVQRRVPNHLQSV